MEEAEKKGQPSTPQDLLTRLKGNRESLHISRINPKTKEDFVKLADEDFCGDYGMALKWLMDGLVNADMKDVVVKLEEHENRISNMENVLAKASEAPEAPATKKMLDGSVKVVGQ